MGSLSRDGLGWPGPLFSSDEAEWPAGMEALGERPLEFVEEVDGELFTGRVGLHNSAKVEL